MMSSSENSLVRASGDNSGYSVVFVFTHATLTRVWRQAAEQLGAEGISLHIVSQMRACDWEAFANDVVATADAVYLDITRHFSAFDRLLAAGERRPMPCRTASKRKRPGGGHRPRRPTARRRVSQGRHGR